MNKKFTRFWLFAALLATAFFCGSGVAMAYLTPSNQAVFNPSDDVNSQAYKDFEAQIQYMGPSYRGDNTSRTDTSYIIGPGSVPDYLTNPNWAFSPPLRKFIDTLPGLTAANANNLGQYIPVAVPDITTFPGSDYYEIELREFREQMHSDLPAAPTKADYAGVVTSGTTLRGYIQVNRGTDTTRCDDPSNIVSKRECIASDNTVVAQGKPHYLGPIIVAQKDRAVRVKFINKLPAGSGGDLFVPVDSSIMGAGPYDVDYDPVTKEPIPSKTGDFAQNRGLLHLHGGRTPWISDGTPHQWITPADDNTTYPTGVSTQNVPDMPDPGPGASTYYWTNQQSSRMMFYHDHAWGITRLNVYVGEAAGYLIRDATEEKLIDNGIIPSGANEIPLVFQEKTYVDASEIPYTDPTWNYGTSEPDANGIRPPAEGDLWWPHVYMPAQNPFDFSGIAPMGRWVYGPYFWPATPNFFQPIPNPYYDEDCSLALSNDSATNNSTPGFLDGFCQPPEMPSTPEPSWGAEAFVDTPIVNGTAYPVLNVNPEAYRFRILNADHDSFINLQMYIADNNPPVPVNTPSNPRIWVHPAAADFSADGYGGFAHSLASGTEVRMLPASDDNVILSTAPPGGPNSGGVLEKPSTWPSDGREGGIPDWSWKGPDWVMIGAEGGFLPQPVVLPAQPLTWNFDPTMFNVGNVNGGSLIIGPAERADVIVDFSAYAGQTLIVYNDATRPWPALDPHYDFYTDAPDRRDMGGHDTTPIGFGPNVRTFMQIKVGNTPSGNPGSNFSLANLKAEFIPAEAVATAPDGVFKSAQDTIIVGQGNLNPASDPALYEAYLGPDTNFSAYNTVYKTSFPVTSSNWGIAQINDKDIHFYSPATGDNETITMKTKSIHDEMGGTFDEFGRLRASLGLVPSDLPVGQATFVAQTYSDPSTEILEEDGIQVWKITHNGVDSHPIHFHLYDVQVLDRVGWDGFLRLPDPTEMGWKDTVRVSPLEDTIVALRPVTPKLPFGVPESYRPLNPATPLEDATHLSLKNPGTGDAWKETNLNRMVNFDWEYVWHCHILSHEENDMMRPVIFQFTEDTTAKPTGLTAATGANGIELNWIDPTPGSDNVTLADPTNEIFFQIERSGGSSTWSSLGKALANATTYADTEASPGVTYSYRVFGVNAADQTGATLSPGPVSDVVTATAADLYITTPLNGSSVQVTDTVLLETSAAGSITEVTFYDGENQIGSTDTSAPFTVNWSGMAGGTHSLTAKGNSGTVTSAVVNVTVAATQAAEITFPADGEHFSGTSNTFIWNTVTDAQSYTLLAGTYSGGSDIGSFENLTSNTQLVTGLPADGSTVYVTLITKYATVQASSDNSYTAMGEVIATMVSPTVSSLLHSPSQTFTWNDAGAELYGVMVGTSLGGGDLGIFPSNVGTTGTSTVVTGLPEDGSTVYVRLYSKVNGVWYYNTYIYTPPMPATMVWPVGTLSSTSSSQTFTWTDIGADLYGVIVGTSRGGEEIGIFPSVAGTTGTSTVVTGLPIDGSIVYVRLYSMIEGVWFYNSYTYPAPLPTTMVSPGDNSTLTSSSQTFTWNETGADLYGMMVGTSLGGSELGIFPSNAGTTGTSTTVSGLPADGSTVYVRLYTQIEGVWSYNSYTYTATMPTTMVSPTDNSTLASSSQTFTWNDTGADLYAMWVGTSLDGSELGIFPDVGTTGMSTTVSGLPTDGSTVYIRLYSQFNGVWDYNSYSYTTTTVP